MIELKPCPFCGGEVKLLVLDDEFNIRYEEYESNPRSGLQYGLSHPVDDNPSCPIATDPYEILGRCGYDTRKEAAETWNRRVDNS